MYMNETVLTPIFRYIITNLEENIESDNNILKIEKFINAIRNYNRNVVAKELSNTDEYILSVTVSVLKARQENVDLAK